MYKKQVLVLYMYIVLLYDDYKIPPLIGCSLLSLAVTDLAQDRSTSGFVSADRQLKLD